MFTKIHRDSGDYLITKGICIHVYCKKTNHSCHLALLQCYLVFSSCEENNFKIIQA